MSQERIEAAAFAVRIGIYNNRSVGEIARAALDNADAVMFSDEAIERAAANAWNTLAARDGGRNWEDLEERMRPYWIANVRVIAAALKGEQ